MWKRRVGYHAQGERGYLGKFHETNFDFGKGGHHKMMEHDKHGHGHNLHKRTLTLREIEALRKRNEDAAGFDQYAPNGYYTNFVRPEAEREYYNNVREGKCIGCEGLDN